MSFAGNLRSRKEDPMLRSNRIRILLGVSVLLGMGVVAFTVAGSLRAQDVNAKATYGEKELKAGFTPDPYFVKLQAGGPIEVARGGFTQYVAKEPDFRLLYQAGNFPLYIRVDSASDTTLLINTPDEQWIVDDDSGGNLNPLIKINNPKSGRYEIWVGTIEKGVTPNATLSISEIK
jgi:hypothetical protein